MVNFQWIVNLDFTRIDNHLLINSRPMIVDSLSEIFHLLPISKQGPDSKHVDQTLCFKTDLGYSGPILHVKPALAN